MKTDYFNQRPYALRCEWGAEGLRRLAAGSDAVVIVDVFSFTTCVDLAVSRGALVYPYGWNDERSVEFAASVGAVLANSSRRDPEGMSLAPRSMLRLEPGQKVVLPSPNGSALSLAAGGIPVFAGCLRNAGAVAAAAAALGPNVAVIPAGERWPDGSLRPALEDLLGAGAVLHALPGRRSPEAEAAVGAFLQFRDRLKETLSACGSGIEALDRGHPEDVELAVALDASRNAPRLIEGRYQAA